MNLIKSTNNVQLTSNEVIKEIHPKFSNIGVGSVIFKKRDNYFVIIEDIEGLATIGVEEVERNDGYRNKKIKVKQFIDGKCKITYSEYETIEGYETNEYRYSQKSMVKTISNFAYNNFNGVLFDSIEQFKEFIENDKVDITQFDITPEDPNTTALVGKVSKELLESKVEILNSKQQHLERIRAGHDYRVACMMNKMELIRREMEERVSLMTKEVNKIMDFIYTIELYMGIHEKVYQLASGETSDEPIQYFQKVLFMDVEYGKPGDETIDFKNIEQFDKWLLEDYNYELFTTPKCVRVFKVRREHLEYDENPYINGMLNVKNDKTYFLIRNGKNLYRIWADINIQKLFPDQDEFMKLQQKAKKDHWTKPEDVEKEFRKYHKQIVALQGISFRTDIFAPLPQDFNLLDGKIHESGLVNFIYNKNELIESNRKTFSEWIKDINSRIEVGGRVLWVSIGKHNDVDYWRFSERFYSYRWKCRSSYSTPDIPNSGDIFHLISKNKVKYNGEFTAMMPFRRSSFYSWEPDKKDGSTKTQWNFDSSDVWLNYDACTLDDVQYYLNSRNERENYMKYFPVLFKLEEKLKEDQKHQEAFKQMILGQINVTSWRVDQAIEWWKQKNKWKRSLQSDDCDHEAKAFRMIIKRLKQHKKDRNQFLKTFK